MRVTILTDGRGFEEGNRVRVDTAALFAGLMALHVAVRTALTTLITHAGPVDTIEGVFVFN